MDTIRDLRLAVLIDADNVPYSNVKGMFEEIAKYGTPTFKRIYAEIALNNVLEGQLFLSEQPVDPGTGILKQREIYFRDIVGE